jgi:hypothetical protein
LFSYISGLTSDKDFLYVSGNFHRIYKFNLINGNLILIAGPEESSGIIQSGGWKDGSAYEAKFKRISGMVVKGDYLYACDSGNNRIRQVNLASGEVSTLAGNGTEGWQDGYGLEAKFNGPEGIVADSVHLYITDNGNSVIRKITIATGQVTTLAGNGKEGLVDGEARNVQFDNPTGITMIRKDLYIADSNNNAIRKVDSVTGETTTLAGSGKKGHIDNERETKRKFYSIRNLTTDGNSLYLPDGYVIKAVDIVSGEVTTIAGVSFAGSWINGIGHKARFSVPYGITIEADYVFISDSWDYRISEEIIRRMNIRSKKVDTL